MEILVVDEDAVERWQSTDNINLRQSIIGWMDKSNALPVSIITLDFTLLCNVIVLPEIQYSVIVHIRSDSADSEQKARDRALEILLTTPSVNLFTVQLA
jgi:hypothetical protein